MAEARSYLSNWNPMSEAHNDPNFNSYDDGPGRNFQAGGSVVKDNTKLYVKNIPLEITEDGLRNVFTNAGGAVPQQVHIPQSKGQFSTNCGFVNFNHPGEASRAIMALHKLPPLYLEVVYRKPKTDARNPTIRQYDTLIPRGDTSPRNQCPAPNPRAGYYDPRGGASGTTDLALTHDLGIAVNLNISAGVDGRRVSCGRGYFPPAPRASGPINSLMGAYPLPNSTTAKSPQVTARVTQAPPLRESLVQTSQAEPSEIVPLPCNSCYRPAMRVCLLCREVRYCNRECADKHWVAHKHSCMLKCEPPGLLPLESPDETTSVPTKPVLAAAVPSDTVFADSVQAKPVLPTPKAHTEQTSALGIDQYEDIPIGEYTEVTVAAPDGSMGWVAVKSRGDRSYETVTDITACKDLAPITDPREGDYVAAEFCSEWYRARVMKTSPLTVFYPDYGTTEKLTLDKIRSLPAKYLKEPAQAVRICVLPSASGTSRSLVENQELRVCAVRKVDNVTFVKLEPDDRDVAPKSAVIEVSKPEKMSTAKMLRAELPAGVLSAVTVVGSASNGGVWVNLVTSASALTDLLERLQRKVVTLPSENVTVGSFVVVTHLRATYRAQVTSVGPAGFTVRLVDEGRDIVVDTQKVRPLPAEFMILEEQAIEIHTKEGVLPKLSDLLEGAEIIVQPIGKNASGATIVEVPRKSQVELACHKRIQPLSKDQATKVYFVSRENDESYVQPATSSALVGEMTKELEMLAATSALKPCANVVVGQVAAANFEGDWSRCKILSIEKGIEVIFIDYGNKFVVAKEDIWELPEKFTHIPSQCMRVHFTSDTPAAVMQLPDFGLFYATLFAEANDGSLIVHGKMQE